LVNCVGVFDIFISESDANGLEFESA
jgi:hypothetical protein